MSKILALRNNLPFLLFLFFLILNFACAAIATVPRQDVIPADVWKDKLKENLPVEACDKGSFFMKCYEISEDKCIKATKESLRDCISKFKLPAKINPYGEGIKFGYKIGLCTGKKMDGSLRSFRRDQDQKCINAN